MARRSFILAFAAMLFVLAFRISDAFGADPPPISREIQQRVLTKHAGHKIVNWCSGTFVRKDTDAVVVLQNQSTKEFLVVWVMPGGIQELDRVQLTDSSSEFELQCMNPKEAKELQDTLRHSEGISTSVEIPKGAGAVCYFIDETVANCWSLDRATGELVRVGAWET